MRTFVEFEQMIPTGIKSNEWYTPACYVEAAREVMGGIDLDPASCETANRTVKATRYYTEEDNGLAQEWYGNVFLNPPYGKIRSSSNEGRSFIGLFIRKLVKEYRQGHVTQAVIVATAQTDATWYHLLCQEFLICFAKDHVKFDCTIPTQRRDGKATHRLGTIFVYLGPNETSFISVFHRFGTIARSVSAPVQQVTRPELWEAS